MQRNMWVRVAALAVVALAILAANFGAPGVAVGAVLIAAPIIWLSGPRDNLAAFVGTLGLQIPQSFGPFRSAVADLFMLPLLAYTAVAVWRGERVPHSTLTKPFVVMGGAFAVGTAIAVVNIGELSRYVIVNRLLGLVYLVAGFYAIVMLTRSQEYVQAAARWFVIGVSASNVAALIMVLAALAGFDNSVYTLNSLRLNGWVGNPSLYGGVLLTAAMIELGYLSFPSATTRFRNMRWVNVWVMVVALILTASRGTWLAASAGAAGLWAALVFTRALRPNLRPAYSSVLVVWAAVPAIALAGIMNANLTAGLGSLNNRVVELRAASKRLTDEETRAAQPHQIPPTRPSTAQSLEAAFRPSGPVMNARGLLDRGAILQLAWSEYTTSVRSMLLGIGLGTFFSISAEHMGFPLIIHNTFAWFLIELGPLGLIALLLIWGRTAINLWSVCNAHDERRRLAVGLMGSFAAMSVFWLVNEGFYQRHYWLIFALADRLYLAPAGNHLTESEIG